MEKRYCNNVNFGNYRHTGFFLDHMFDRRNIPSKPAYLMRTVAATETWGERHDSYLSIRITFSVRKLAYFFFFTCLSEILVCNVLFFSLLDCTIFLHRKKYYGFFYIWVLVISLSCIIFFYLWKLKRILTYPFIRTCKF